MGKDLEGCGRGLIDALSRHLSAGTEEAHDKPQSGYPMFRSAFEQ
jgi:hypothetical protein